MVVNVANHSRLPTILFTIFAAIMLVFSIFTMLDLFLAAAGQYGTEIVSYLAAFSGLLSLQAIIILAIVLAVLIVIVFAVALAISWLMSKIATEVTVIAMFAVPVLLFTAAGLIGLLGFTADQLEVVLLPVGILGVIGVIALVIILWKLSTVLRAGKFIEFAAQLMIDNKSLYFFPIIMAATIAITFTFGAFSAIWVWMRGSIILVYIEQQIIANAGNQAMIDSLNSQASFLQIGMAVAIFIIEAFYLLTFFVIYYIITGMIMAYAARWYRGEDPGPRSAYQDIKQVLPVIITFATFTTTVHLFLKSIRNMQLRSRNPIVSMVLGIFLFFAGSFYAFFTYFTLPAIVIKKKGFLDSAEESGMLVWRSAIEVLMSDTGFGLSMTVFSLINRIIWFIVGFAIGSGLSEATGGVLVDNVVVGFIVGIVFFLFLAGMSMSLISMPMKAAFTTFLYSFAIDKEDGFKLPSKLPVELRNEFSAFTNKAIANNKRKMADPTGKSD
ncbi:MAG: hypothetical protein ACXAEU_22805 [Candidatus Hodarchaeales archaeon]|jgi:hypothetical protein